MLFDGDYKAFFEGRDAADSQREDFPELFATVSCDGVNMTGRALRIFADREGDSGFSKVKKVATKVTGKKMKKGFFKFRLPII